MLTFSHPGKIGDLLYSIHYCLDRTAAEGEDGFSFNIQTNISPVEINRDWHDNNKLLTDKDAVFIKPLLEAQPYINNVTINSPETVILLSDYMCCKINQLGAETRDWYYQTDDNVFPREFWKPSIFAKPNTAYDKYKDRLVIGKTGRYNNLLIDWNKLAPYAEHLVFLGTDEEHERFKAAHFNVAGLIPSDTDSLLDCAELLMSCKGYIGGQSGLYALAEMMKVPRILLTPDWVLPEGYKPGDMIQAVPGPKNVCPMGGKCCTVNRSERLLAVIDSFL